MTTSSRPVASGLLAALVAAVAPAACSPSTGDPGTGTGGLGGALLSGGAGGSIPGASGGATNGGRPGDNGGASADPGGAGGGAGSAGTGGDASLATGGAGTSSGGAPGAGGAPPATFTLVVDAPRSGDTVSGTVTVSGWAPGFVNVEVWDDQHSTPPLARGTPASNGAFTIGVDASALASGATTWTVHAWDAPAGSTFTHDATVTLTLTLGTGKDGGSPPGPVVFAMGSENKDGPLSDFEAAVSCDVNIKQVTTGWCGDWSNWASTGCNVYAGAAPFMTADTKHVVELSLAPWPESLAGQSFAACAKGDYDAHYADVANTWLAQGLTRLFIRLGYEWDGNWFPWGTGLHETGSVTNQGQGGTALQYAACFARFDTVIQGVAAGSAAKPLWRMVMNPIHDTVGTKEAQLQQVLDAAGGGRHAGGHVDVLGVDLYDYPSRNNTDSRMLAAIAFAKKNALPLSFPEWGVGGDSRAEPAVDDAGVTFITKMAGYFADPANGIAYASYFNCSASACAGLHALTPPNNPSSRAKFAELFGNGKLGCGADARKLLESL